ncbi:MAG TPA: TRAP transporter small permease [Paracoccus sp. (in: a-proteobacteria)]|uniref:TRAP transporter small permease n=1 Tax=uncultured Paracoccus sp. TaxID=189685 RepID=UPI0026336C48|nr:TRAP transporter small permease [uncultured Paracoccus sp.]HMQ41645.1 TRAP transporter small permease [Paracoccus sp. (in: a-proteobacteria)]HMR34683.1 TRAP transporter small permease [Paracoccus sp. (in: a-proteobacteria)]
MKASKPGLHDSATERATRPAKEEPMLRSARKAAEWLMALTHNIAALLLAVASVLVIYQVFTRFVLGSASGWSEVASRATVIWMVFIAVGVGFRTGAMISLEFIRSILPDGARRAVMALVTGLTLLFLVVLGWYGVLMTLRVQNQQVAMLGVSMSWLYAAIPVGCLLAIPGVILGHLDPPERPDDREEAA